MRATLVRPLVGLIILGASPALVWQGIPALASLGSPVAQDTLRFLGAEACLECHRSQYEAWAGSTHGRAGGTPSPETVIAPFDGQPIRFADALVIPAVNDSGHYTFTIEAGGIRSVISVDAVIGGGHMVGGGTQAFLSDYPDGTTRFLPFDFSRSNGVWFCTTAGRANRGWVPITESVRLSDCADWPPARAIGDAFRLDNCQQCHGSQIGLDYDPTSRRYETRVTDFRINCESCHGPGSEHVALATTGSIANAADIGVRSFGTEDKDASLEVCFQCHAAKGLLEPEYVPGNSLSSHYSLKLYLLGEQPFYPDGRINSFGYQQNHTFSDCYLNGSMTCVDCHDPHGQGYRDIYRRPLEGRFSNGQCLACHASKGDVTAHTFHGRESAGSQCVGCHMPFLQQPAVGNQIRYSRSDHTIPIPRPGFDESLGATSACQSCHPDQSALDLQRQTREWYGELKPHKAIVRSLLAADTLSSRAAAASALLRPDANHPIAQVMALQIFTSRFLSPDDDADDRDAVARLIALANSDDADVRAVALATLHLAYAERPEVERRIEEELSRAGTDSHQLRARWAAALTLIANAYRADGDLASAIVTQQKALDVIPDNTAALLTLAQTSLQAGDYESAERYFEETLRSRDASPLSRWIVDPNIGLLLVNLGTALELQGENTRAADVYWRAIEADPREALGYFRLGSYHLRQELFEDAITLFRQTLALNPNHAPAFYSLARAYLGVGDIEQALAAAEQALRIDPGNEDALELRQRLRSDRR